LCKPTNDSSCHKVYISFCFVNTKMCIYSVVPIKHVNKTLISYYVHNETRARIRLTSTSKFILEGQVHLCLMHSIFYSDKSPTSRCICGRHRWHLGPPNRCREESPTVPTQREPPVGLLHTVAVHGEEPSSSSAPLSTSSPSASPLLNMQHQLEAARHTPRCRRCGAPQPAPPRVFVTPHRLLPHAPSSSPFLQLEKCILGEKMLILTSPLSSNTFCLTGMLRLLERL
jgi:hypothetical protein